MKEIIDKLISENIEKILSEKREQALDYIDRAVDSLIYREVEESVKKHKIIISWQVDKIVEKLANDGDKISSRTGENLDKIIDKRILERIYQTWSNWKEMLNDKFEPSEETVARFTKKVFDQQMNKKVEDHIATFVQSRFRE